MNRDLSSSKSKKKKKQKKRKGGKKKSNQQFENIRGGEHEVHAPSVETTTPAICGEANVDTDGLFFAKCGALSCPGDGLMYQNGPNKRAVTEKHAWPYEDTDPALDQSKSLKHGLRGVLRGALVILSIVFAMVPVWSDRLICVTADMLEAFGGGSHGPKVSV